MYRTFGRTALAALIMSFCWSATANAVRISLYPVKRPPTGVFAWQGGVLFTEVTTGSPFVSVMSVTPFRLASGPPGVGGRWIAVGPDGKLWLDSAFVEALPENKSAIYGALYEISASGVELRFKYPQQWDQPYTPGEFVTGPDHALWVADPAGYIERYDPLSGKFTVYRTPGYFCPLSIIDGPEGALWFTNNRGGTIGRITTAGDITEYLIEDGRTQLGHSYAAPNSLVEGPDHAIWFTEWDRIGRMTPSGQLQEFTIPNPNNIIAGQPGAPQPRSIAVGPEGDIYFTDVGDSAIGRILLPSGQLIEYPVDTGKGLASSPSIIAKGPEGKMWFNETGDKFVGSVDPNAEPLPNMTKTAAHGTMTRRHRPRPHRCRRRHRRPTTCRRGR